MPCPGGRRLAAGSPGRQKLFLKIFIFDGEVVAIMRRKIFLGMRKCEANINTFLTAANLIVRIIVSFK